MKQKIIFQSSMPRSGGTLLQNILSQNPEFYATPTSPLHTIVNNIKHNYTESSVRKGEPTNLYDKPYMNFIKKGIKGYVKSMTNKPYFFDKGRGWLDEAYFLDKLYKNWKCIVLVRDLRDIIASFEKLHRQKPHIIPQYRMENPNAGRSTNERTETQLFNSISLRQTLPYIYDYTYLVSFPNILFIKYEDLCTDPQSTIEKIYNHIGAKKFTHNFNKIKQSVIENDNAHASPIDHNTRKKLKQSKTDAKQILGEFTYNKIYQQNKWFFEAFGYPE